MSDKYYFNGRYVLIRQKEYYLIRIKPYKIYPINESGLQIMKKLERYNDLNDICRQINVVGVNKDKIKRFLDKCVDDNILSKFYQKNSGIRIKERATTPYLERIFFEITNACNLKCSHCYMSAAYGGRKADKIPLERIKEVIETADRLGVYRMDFTGGEIFTRNDLYEVLKTAMDHYMITNIFTNATLIDDEQVRLLTNLGNIRTIFISLDDCYATEHDKFRGVDGAFENTIKAIKKLKETDIKVVANITMSPHNINHIEQVIKYCRENLGIECRTAPILQVGRGKSYEENNLTFDEIKMGMNLTLRASSKFTTGFCDDDALDGKVISGCGVGHKMIYIRSNGEICLCPTLSSRENKEFGLGNIYEDNLKELWESNITLDEFRRSTCSNNDCEHLAICRGGCRSRAFLNGGGLNGIDQIICHYFGMGKLTSDSY